jgi:hypothetical protein
MDTEGNRMVADSTDDGRGPEGGQAAMWFILTMAFLFVALGVTAYSRLVSATDEVSSLQTAADAAALAGAQAIARDAPQAIKDAVSNGGGIPCGLGRGEAQAFAARNGANVTGYCYYPVQDRIEVTVRSQAVLESGRQENASAVSELDLRLGPCVLPDAPEPPEPEPTPHADPVSIVDDDPHADAHSDTAGRGEEGPVRRGGVRRDLPRWWRATELRLGPAEDRGRPSSHRLGTIDASTKTAGGATTSHPRPSSCSSGQRVTGTLIGASKPTCRTSIVVTSPGSAG